MGDPTTVEYRVLGPIEVLVRGARRPLSGVRQELLLAALVLSAGREVANDQLIELLWEEGPPSHPEAALRSQVARLRRNLALGADDLAFGGRGYVLTSGGGADVERFEVLAGEVSRAYDEHALHAATAALALWRSTSLPFSDRPVLRPVAVRLLEMRAAIAERRAELLVDQGRAPEAVIELQTLLAERPEQEAHRALLMEALYVSGRPVEAIDVYRSWADQLRERGLEPSARLRSQELRILRDDPATATRPAGPWAPAAPVPAPSTSFLGREDDVEHVAQALHDHRLVTLAGPGGVGKTRLAWELLRASDPESVINVDLSAVDERTDVLRLIAGAAAVTETGGGPLIDQLVERFAQHPCLLFLDNCEHVVEHVAALVATVLERAPASSVLATSQRRLNLDGEWIWPVTPLPIEGMVSPAVQLFVDRARGTAPHLVFDGSETDRIQRICGALDGLPLGIEIAAAQTSALTLADLEAELEHPLELEAPPNRPARHRTLRSVIDWTYRRLDEREQHAFERLSVFVGTFDVSAARSVLRDVMPSNQVAASIVQLVERNLIVFEPVDVHGRYRLLQSVRAFGLDRLRATGALHAAQATHAAWAVEFAEAAARDLADEERTTVQQLDRCFDELRAAHHWLVAFDAHAAMRLIHALHPYAVWHGRTEVFRWAEVVAALDCTSPLQSSVKASVCAGAWIRGDLRAAELAAQAALATISEPASPLSHRAFEQAGEVALQRGDADRAVAMYDRALKLGVLVGDRMQATWDLGSSALVLHYTGSSGEAGRRAEAATAIAARVASPSARSFAAFVLGEIAAARHPDQARHHLHEAVRLAESVGNDFIAAIARVTLASLEPAGGNDLAATIDHYRSAVTSWDRAGAWFAQLVTLRSILTLLASKGAMEDAATLYGAVVAGARSASPIYGPDQARIENVRTAINRELGEQRATCLAEIGEQLERPEVTAFTLRALNDLRNLELDERSRAQPGTPQPPERSPSTTS